jgi:hypothetical protein
MSKSAATDNSLLLRLRQQDARHAVTRQTLRKLADQLGMSDTETVHYALAALRDQLLPQYPMDDGPLSEHQLQAVREATPQDDYHPTESLIPGL